MHPGWVSLTERQQRNSDVKEKKKPSLFQLQRKNWRWKPKEIFATGGFARSFGRDVSFIAPPSAFLHVAFGAMPAS